MDVTRVVFYSRDHKSKSLAVCSVILDDELRLNDISLFKNERGYFLVLPSKQDIYSGILKLNEDKTVSLPRNPLEESDGKKKYQEFYHPVRCSVYKKILDAVVKEYEKL